MKFFLVWKNQNGVATRRCKEFETLSMITRFDIIHERDRQMDRHVRTMAGRSRAEKKLM